MRASTACAMDGWTTSTPPMACRAIACTGSTRIAKANCGYLPMAASTACATCASPPSDSARGSAATNPIRFWPPATAACGSDRSTGSTAWKKAGSRPSVPPTDCPGTRSPRCSRTTPVRCGSVSTRRCTCASTGITRRSPGATASRWAWSTIWSRTASKSSGRGCRSRSCPFAAARCRTPCRSRRHTSRQILAVAFGWARARARCCILPTANSSRSHPSARAA